MLPVQPLKKLPGLKPSGISATFCETHRGSFRLTFGERHLSLKCLRRSLAATALILLGIFLVFYLEGFHFQTFYGVDSISLNIFLLSVLSPLPDFVALGKARLLLFLFRGGLLLMAGFLILDVILSAFVSSLLPIGLTYARTQDSLITLIRLYYSTVVAGLAGKGTVTASTIALVSTLFTSIWVATILLSTIIMKILSPIHRFTAWFFYVEKHPIRAIGIVSSALLMMSALVWTIVRAIK
jgi:hypothetical protein